METTDLTIEILKDIRDEIRHTNERVERVETGLADAITVGTHALANPDLVARLRSGASLNEADRSTFYGGDERGYLDYPTLAQASQ